jgi:hypothetical protein
VRDEDSVASDALEPRDDILRIADAAAQEKQLRLRRCERQRELVVHAAH